MKCKFQILFLRALKVPGLGRPTSRVSGFAEFADYIIYPNFAQQRCLRLVLHISFYMITPGQALITVHILTLLARTSRQCTCRRTCPAVTQQLSSSPPPHRGVTSQIADEESRCAAARRKTVLFALCQTALCYTELIGNERYFSV